MTEIVVQTGECLSSIAKKHGFADWRKIYGDPNNASFRELRPDPNVILGGDVLWIPELEIRQQSGATEGRHRFQLHPPKTLFRTVLLDEAGDPLAEFDTRLEIGDLVLEGRTDADGLFEQQIPANAERGTLTLNLGDGPFEGEFVWQLEFGRLDPVQEISGVQARLNNLGHFCGAVDGLAGSRTAAALESFQMDAGLPVTRVIDDPTRAALLAAHGC